MKKITRTAATMAALILATGTTTYAAREGGDPAMETSKMKAVSEAVAESPATWEILQNLIHEQLEVDYDRIKMEAFFYPDLGADSAKMANLIVACENEFGIEIPSKDAEEFQQVSHLYDYIYSLVG